MKDENGNFFSVPECAQLFKTFSFFDRRRRKCREFLQKTDSVGVEPQMVERAEALGQLGLIFTESVPRPGNRAREKVSALPRLSSSTLTTLGLKKSSMDVSVWAAVATAHSGRSARSAAV